MPKSVKNKIIKKHRKEVYKVQDFETYVLWKSLPAILKGMGVEELKKLGIKEEVEINLLSIKNQTDFCERFNINKDTLPKWNKKIDELDLIKDSIKFWAKKLTPNVITGLYRGTLRGGAAEAKLWFQYIEEWSEKSQIDVGSAKEIKEMADAIRKLANKK